jgi:hypothetical protein
MDEAGPPMRPWILWATSIAICLIGVALIQYGLSIEPYHDQARADQLMAADYCFYGDASEKDAQAANWYRERDALLTSHYSLINAGSSLVVATVAFGLLMLWLRLSGNGNLPLFRTPSRKWHFFVAGSAIVIGSYFGLVFGLDLDLERRMFPWCADSIAIPMFGLGFVTLVALPITLLVGFVITLFFRTLPVSLWQRDTENALRSWAATIAFGSFALIWFWILLDVATTSDFLLAGPAVFAIYLTLSCRAAILAPATKED